MEVAWLKSKRCVIPILVNLGLFHEKFHAGDKIIFQRFSDIVNISRLIKNHPCFLIFCLEVERFYCFDFYDRYIIDFVIYYFLENFEVVVN